MYVKTGIYIYFSAFAALGMILGIILCGSFGFSPSVSLYSNLLFPSSGIRDTVTQNFIQLLKPTLLIFLSGFTLYASVLSIGSVVYTGAVFGSLMLTLCRSKAMPVIYIAGVILCTSLIAFQVYIGSNAVSQRSYLQTAAPSPTGILHSVYCKTYICRFLIASAILLIFTLAVYFLLPLIIVL